MKKLSAISRADLLRGYLSAEGLNDDFAALLGYEREPKTFESAKKKAPGQSLQQNEDTGGGLPSQPPDPETEFPATQPSLKFLMPTHAETLIPDPPPSDPGNPISDAELSVPWKERGLPLQPLVPWARLGSFLKNRLGVSVPGSRLNDRKLMRLASSGRPMTVLPRRMRTTWASQAVILRDDTPEMYPFSQDVDALCQRLRRERGSSGLKIITLRNVPETRNVSRISNGTPILAISSMGNFTNNNAARLAWQRLSRRLAFRDHTFFALNPCPQNRWEKSLAESWPTAPWDRGRRLPRRGGVRALPKRRHVDSAAETLLNLLSPASLIEPVLLRHVRLSLGRTADAGTEWDAWHHEDCWKSMNCFGLRPGDAWNKRLQTRAELAKSQLRLIAKTATAISIQHRTCSEVIAAEAELRACLTGAADEATLTKIAQLLSRVVDRLRQLAEEPGSQTGERTGLSTWFKEMVDRLSPEIRQHSTVQDSIARGLALAYTWINTPSTEVPSGVNPEQFAAESRSAATRIVYGGNPVDYHLAFNGAELEFFHDDAVPRGFYPLAEFRTPARGRFTAKIKADMPQQHSLQPATETRTSIVAPSTALQIEIESSHARLQFESIARPAWAKRMWYDRFGIAAEFLMGTVPFVLRWIPPGRFLMGSPDDENGRFKNEGPQHQVTISRGFWMGETPVTQNQWSAVVQAGKANQSVWKRLFPEREIKSAPSHFQDSDDLPVEQVTWHDSSNFCQLLNALVPEPPNFTLPTEAKWEYACRAGTQAAFHDGSPCTEPEGTDPALERLGWYGKNSGGKTQPVKGKLPNAWGLYDMHGNVWEWCADAWDSELYNSWTDVMVDPVNPGDSSAYRVLRGGAWGNSAQGCRAACRYDGLPGDVWHRCLRLSAGQEQVVLSAEPTVPKRRSRG